MPTNGANSPRSSRGKGAGGAKKLYQWIDAIKIADVSPVTRSVCLALAGHFSSKTFEKGWPVTLKQLMEETGWGKQTVVTHLQKAAAAGLIRKQLCSTERGYRDATRYYPTFPSIKPESTSRTQDLPKPESTSYAPESTSWTTRKGKPGIATITEESSKGTSASDRINPYLAAKEGISVKHVPPGYPNPLAAWERLDGDEVLP